MSWLLPALLYILLVGFLGVSVKFALREIGWQELVVWTAIVYLGFGLLLVFLGTPVGLHGGLNGVMILVSALIPAVSVALFFFALSKGNASRIAPLTSAYPAVTVMLSLLLLSERLSWTAGLGLGLVIAGVILLSL